MGSFSRKADRNKAKQEGTFVYKKVLARKLGCTVNELNQRLKQREKNLKKLEEIENGTE